ncbi:pectate lyase [Mucilaginibacter terrae]|uniref:PelA/Pel-15E family pectate lyase n=1 Tax=Mucilaginibacter terrae TaxID=1955052 RepID=A0ABU3GSI8_9SPHI|nr:pectate lyase [Mucilaginibacter terrae]MDT3402551.1 PelA/Pel-15E family pectate lyase [Mucilaginibacter terrae]
MKQLLPIILLALGIQQVCAQDKPAGHDISLSIFASSASHWYGIKDKHNVINPQKNQPRYKADDLEAIGDNILLYQKKNGGWPKNYDVTAILTPDQKDSLINDKGNLNTTFDNSTSYTHVAFLAKIYNVTHAQRFSDAAIKGIKYILEAQYSNGGWPQYYPLEKGYSRHITYNDDAFVGIMEVLGDVKDNAPVYAFLSDDLRAKVSKAFNKGIECILNTQIKDKSGLTAWCQQHDEFTLQPAWARAFEPPSICNAESVGIVQLLMSLDNPSPQVINAVQQAVKWFKTSAIQGIRVKDIQAAPDTSQYTVSHSDKVVVQDPNAPPIWTRYYELATHRPMFCNRDSKVVYSLAEVARERRSGYAWYTYSPQKVINKYPAWAKKWGIGD